MGGQEGGKGMLEGRERKKNKSRKNKPYPREGEREGRREGEREEEGWV